VLSTVASQSLGAAADAIQRALVLQPHDRSLLERLRAVHEARGNWERAVGVAVELAEATGLPDARARALVEAARFCSERTGNTARAVALYEAAIEDDPQVAGAFAAIEEELIRAEDFRGVASAYERQLERLSQTDAREGSAASCHLAEWSASTFDAQLRFPRSSAWFGSRPTMLCLASRSPTCSQG
jgi:tetratricopeptide (TPR) repeat protein